MSNLDIITTDEDFVDRTETQNQFFEEYEKYKDILEKNNELGKDNKLVISIFGYRGFQLISNHISRENFAKLCEKTSAV